MGKCRLEWFYMPIFEVLVFPLSSLLTLISIYLNLSVTSLQQIALVLMVILLLSSKYLLSSDTGKPIPKALRLLFLLFISSLVQVWVLSSGGIRSPFLILLHLSAVALAFLINLSSSISFLLSSLVTLGLYIVLNQNAKLFFSEDPGTSLLYFSSFLVIVPLSMLISRNYHLKDKVLNLVKRQLKLQEIQHETVLKGISELVLVLDRNLNILSVNEAVERELSISETALIRRPVFEVLFLKNKAGQMVDAQYLSIDRVLAENSTRIINGLLLVNRNKSFPKPVNVQVRPVTNLEGAVDQVTIVISDAVNNYLEKEQKHPGLEAARIKQQAMVEDLKKRLTEAKFPDLKTRLDLIWKVNEDLINSIELEDHIFEQHHILIDIAQLCQKVVLYESEFAKSLGVGLSFRVLNFGPEDIEPLIPKGFQISPFKLTGPFFTVPIDIKWMDLLLQKLLDLVILLTSSIKDPKVSLNLDREGKEFLIITITSNFIFPETVPEQDIINKDFSSLGNTTNLKFGSGLEGFIAKTISTYLNIPIIIEIDKTLGVTNFKLKINKIFENYRNL